MNLINFISSLISLILLIANVYSFDKDLFCNCRPNEDNLNEDQNINFPFISSIGTTSLSLKFLSGIWFKNLQTS